MGTSLAERDRKALPNDSTDGYQGRIAFASIPAAPSSASSKRLVKRAKHRPKGAIAAGIGFASNMCAPLIIAIIILKACPRKKSITNSVPIVVGKQKAVLSPPMAAHLRHAGLISKTPLMRWLPALNDQAIKVFFIAKAESLFPLLTKKP